MSSSSETTVPATQSQATPGAERLALLWIFPHKQPTVTGIPQSLLIGRGRDCDVAIDSARVSRRHLEIRRNGPLLVGEDLGSRNGTYVNGDRFKKGPLGAGSLLCVGDALGLIYSRTEGENVGFSEIQPGVFGGHTLRRALRELERSARSRLPIVIQGESGSGKEGVARAVHQLSGATGRFVPLNCGALPANLVDSELFGHKRGAFTGAERSNVGLIEASDGGTLFLDEVLELPLCAQAKLLRVLQEGEVLPLGSSRPVQVKLRVVVAAQQLLASSVEKGTFREDLFARLQGVTIDLPPLRERAEDIPFLLQHFLSEQFGQRPPIVKAPLVEALCLYSWPLNVRELLAVSKQLGVLHGHETELKKEHLPSYLRDRLLPINAPSSREDDLSETNCTANANSKKSATVDEFTSMLSETGGNVQRTCRVLGITRSRAYRLISSHGIDIQGLRGA